MVSTAGCSIVQLEDDNTYRHSWQDKCGWVPVRGPKSGIRLGTRGWKAWSTWIGDSCSRNNFLCARQVVLSHFGIIHSSIWFKICLVAKVASRMRSAFGYASLPL